MGLLLATPAAAEDKPNGRMQTCTQAWQDAGRTQPYKVYLRQCLSKPVTVAATKTTKTRKAKAKATAAGKAARPNRMKVCGAQWQKLKAEGATGGQTWREFSRQCLKG
jgi:hypothetical protein